MPNLHDIERRIASVSSTKQITRTMEMVAAAKINGSTLRLTKSAPYTESMQEMLANVASQTSGAESPLLAERDEVKHVLIVAVVSDRGLAGGFNSNVLRQAEGILKDRRAAGAEVSVIACGKKGIGYFKYRGVEPSLEFVDLSADPTVEEASSIAAYVIDGYTNEELDEVVVVYNHVKNAGEQVPVTETVLPVDTEALLAGAKEQEEAADGVIAAGYEFEPEAAEVLASLLPAYVRTTFFHALVDSAAGEQAARRAAMKSATDNANEMVDTLTRIYNRVRQSAITTEINEIVGGAAALED